MSHFFKTRYLVLLLLIAGCTPIVIRQLDHQYGKTDVSRYLVPTAPISGVPEYWSDIRPILEQRCTVCHGCYDSPCQQNLTAWDGIVRGANPEQIYTLRLMQIDPSRLFVDAQIPVEWRNKNFHPVLNERENTPQANLQGSVLYRLLDLKRKNPMPVDQVLDEKVYTFSLDRKQACPAIETMDSFEKTHPEWGMPYGLPPLSDREFTTIEKWLVAGAPVAPPPALPPPILLQVQDWETFFNGHSTKQQLMSRYIYEHLFLGHLYFDEVKTQAGQRPVFFRLVRSSTPPGQPIGEIATRRPYDDPGVEPFWYRLRQDESSLVEKNHMPYALNRGRQLRWTQLFLSDNYSVEVLPGYDPKIAGNPFVIFQALPVNSRYRFLLDESRFAIDNFIKGPVCRGQVALNVIDDHFWVFFQNPDSLPDAVTAEFLAKESDNLRLPNENNGKVRAYQWFSYKEKQKKHLRAKAEYLQRQLIAASSLDKDVIWSGEGSGNGALTIFRHNDSATVVEGLVGQAPKTAWVMGYTLLERIHYLLVAGYDVYGGLGHQMNTRLYMDFMRMEGESNFLNFLPRDSRLAVRDHWYRGTSEDVKDFVYGKRFDLQVETSIRFQTKDYQKELYRLFADRVGYSLDNQGVAKMKINKSFKRPLQTLQGVRGEGLAFFPQNSILRVDGSNGQHEYFTLVNNSGYSNNSELFGEDKRRLPAEDYLTVVPGILGAYPNFYFQVDKKTLGRFAEQVASIRSDDDYTALVNNFGVRRTDPDFWAFSDTLHEYFRRVEPVTSGVLDYNRLENR